MRDLKGVNLYLVGMMGSGKSTTGKILAEHLGYRFLDTDAVIEQAAGQSIREIFATSGEDAFRELETQVLGQLAAYQRLAVATGGGIVLQRQNWSYLRHGIVVWLDVPLAELGDRLQQDQTRPILQDTDMTQKLQTLMEQRQPLYAQADVRITVRPAETPDALALRILDEIQQVLKPERHPDAASESTPE
ncbi:MAG: shikimate kinase [Oculatellaceae cyanobacterium Prado106]|jgi:shikimate kinase|nr:shikimate kinase [Oculatellaceae cyanobacterium Prado106]